MPRELWTPNKNTLQKINVIKEQYKKEGAMTLRRCYYVLVGKHLIKNSKNSYIGLSKLFKLARVHGYLPYQCIIDTARSIYKRTTYSTFSDAFNELVEDYKQNSMLLQNYHVELWIEKEAISNLIYPVLYNLDVPLIVSKGFTSVTFKAEAAKRFNEIHTQGKKIKVFFLSDFDCEGEYIPTVLKEDMINDHDCNADFEIVKILLNENHIKDYNLISNIDYKINDVQRKKLYVANFIEKYGAVQYELDALPSDEIKRMVLETLKNILDVAICEKNDITSHQEVEQWLLDHYK